MVTKEELDDWYDDEESPFDKPESSLYQLPYLVIRTSTLKTLPVGWQKSLNLLLKIASTYGVTPDIYDITETKKSSFIPLERTGDL